MRMHFLTGGRLRMRRSVFYPDAPRDALVELPVLSTLLRHPQGNVLFDTGCHPAVATDATSRWGSMAKFMTPISGPRDNPLDQLGGLGLGAHDIDVVVCSHLHSDHCGCNALFPRATVICHRKEMAAARGEDAARAGYVAADWDQPNPTELIDGERDLYGDGRIVLLPMPGHTPGLICAAVALDRDGLFLLASDAVSVRASLDRDYAPRNTWDVELLMHSLAEIRRIEASGATVVCGHDEAQWEGLRKGEVFYD